MFKTNENFLDFFLWFSVFTLYFIYTPVNFKYTSPIYPYQIPVLTEIIKDDDSHDTTTEWLKLWFKNHNVNMKIEHRLHGFRNQGQYQINDLFSSSFLKTIHKEVYYSRKTSWFTAPRLFVGQ